MKKNLQAIKFGIHLNKLIDVDDWAVRTQLEHIDFHKSRKKPIFEQSLIQHKNQRDLAQQYWKLFFEQLDQCQI
jgi:hypothetical protein